MAKKRHRDPEYVLHVFHHVDERTRKKSVAFLVRTVKEFTNFSYHILLDASRDGQSVVLSILGLRTSPLIMPGMGPAQGRKDFQDLEGSCSLSVKKLNGESNHFRVHISPTQIQIEEVPQRPFIIISNQPVELPGEQLT